MSAGPRDSRTETSHSLRTRTARERRCSRPRPRLCFVMFHVTVTVQATIRASLTSTLCVNPDTENIVKILSSTVTTKYQVLKIITVQKTIYFIKTLAVL